jgi:hypothetical protein
MNNYPVVVFSYREEHQFYFRNELDGRLEAKIRIKTCKSEDELVEHIARLDTECFTDLDAMGKSDVANQYVFHHRIVSPQDLNPSAPEIDDYEGSMGNGVYYSEAWEGVSTSRISARQDELLNEHRERKKERARQKELAAKKAADEAEERAKQESEKKDQQEYLRLKAKYENVQQNKENQQ